MVSRGEIWLANLNPTKRDNEMGKVRPVLIYQNNALNHNGYPTTIVIPLSTSLIDDAQPIRYRIPKQEGLEKDSDIIITQIRAIDNERFVSKLATLSHEAMERIGELFEEITS